MSDIELLGENLDENFDRFLAEAEDTGCVWGLEGPDGWALCQSNFNEELDVLPLWSQPEYAQIHCVDEWRDFKVVPISLEELLDDWLVGLHEDLTMIGPNWNSEMEGDEIEPLDLLAEFEEEDE